MDQSRRFLMSLVAVATLSTLAPAQTVPMLARLNGAQEVPATPSLARGLGFTAIDVPGGTVTYREV